MRTPRGLAHYRNRFNQLAAAVGSAREGSHATLGEVQALRAELASLAGPVGSLAEQVKRLADAAEAQTADLAGFRTDAIEGLRRVHANEAWHRRRLRAVRDSAEYERAFTAPDPLISVLIATYERLDLLRERTLPSVMAQEYRNFEIVIVGDNSPYGEAQIREGFEDAPIRFANLTMRGPYPEEPLRRWQVAGTPPLNEAMHLALGAWLAPFDDDDRMRPRHLRVLLDHARKHRLEFVYGRFHYHLPEIDRPHGSFPPRLGEIGLQVALMHGALRFFELELADAIWGVPNDWGYIERLARAGVRIGMIDEVVTDYHPSVKPVG